MAVLFPRLRDWKNSVLRSAGDKFRRRQVQRRLRGTVAAQDLTLRVRSAATAESFFAASPLGRTPQKSADGSCVRWLLYPAKTVELALPKTIEGNDEGGFLPWRSFVQTPSFVYRFTNSFYHGECGAVIDRTGCVLNDLLDALPGRFAATHELPAPKSEPHFCDGAAAVLSSSQNHYHWLIKMLPRLHLLEESGFPVNECKALFINQPTSAQAQGYAAAGLGAQSLRIVKSRHFCSCRQLYVSTVSHDVPRWSLDYLRRTFAAEMKPTRNWPRAIYLSRRSASTRKVRNEDEVAQHLRTEGIETVDLSEWSFAEQIEMVAHADLIVAPHGAALSNLAFAKPDAQLLEIFLNAETQKCYWMMARRLGILYHYFVAEPVPTTEDATNADMIIPIEKLQRALDFLRQDRGKD